MPSQESVKRKTQSVKFPPKAPACRTGRDSPTAKIGYRPTWAEINLGNLAYNFAQVKNLLLPEVKVMACVKADAYGHGLIPVAKRLESCGVDFLSVASLDEGIKLRRAGIKLPILVLGMCLEKDASAIFSYNITPALCSDGLAVALNRLAKSRGKKIPVHIKVDTGMGRLGVLYKDARQFIERTAKLKYLEIQGIFTHLACADKNEKFTVGQINILRDLVSALEHRAIHIPFIHAANSLGVVDYPQSHFNLVRPGLILYGLYPKDKLKIKLKPVLSLKTRVVFAKRVPAGWGISYGHRYITKCATNIITLPIGYGDGYPRNLSNRAPVLIRGKKFKISGVICMDQLMVDIGGLKVKTGEEVVLIGSQGKEKITAEELARLGDTIAYEIACGLGQGRIPRVYLGV